LHVSKPIIQSLQHETLFKMTNSPCRITLHNSIRILCSTSLLVESKWKNRLSAAPVVSLPAVGNLRKLSWTNSSDQKKSIRLFSIWFRLSNRGSTSK